MQKTLVLLLMICLAGTCLPAQEAAAGESGASGIYRYFDVVPDLRLWGAEVDLSLGLGLVPGLDTGLWTRASAAWETVGYYQDPQGQYPLAGYGTPLPADQVQYSRWDIKGGVGLFQGLVFDPVKDRNALEFLGAWMYQYDLLDPVLASDGWLSGATGQIQTEGGLSFFLADLKYDGQVKDGVTRIKRGAYAEVYGEYAPAGFYSASQTEWLRLGGVAKAYLPVFETSRKVLPEGEKTPVDWNEFSAYLAGHLVFDQLLALNAEPLPHQVANITGGLLYRYGLGGLVRGMADGYLAGTTKCAGNIEFRLMGPAFIHKDLVPILLAYLDAGLTYGAETGLQSAFGSGLGLMVDLFGLAEVGLYTQFNFPGTNEQGVYWTPVGIGFGFQF